MRKVRIIAMMLMLVVCGLIFTGCQATESEMKEIVEALKENGILSANVELVDTVTRKVDNPAFGAKKTVTYIYRDSYGKLYGVQIENNTMKTDEGDYRVIIYKDISLANEKIEYLSSKEAKYRDSYEYQDRTFSKNNKYNFENREEYIAYKNKNVSNVKEKYTFNNNLDVDF